MGCGSSTNAVQPKNKNEISKDVKISQFGENFEEDMVDNKQGNDFFEKIKNAQLPQNPEQSQQNIRQKRKQRELQQGGFLKKLVGQANDED